MRRSSWLVLLLLLAAWDPFEVPHPDVEKGNAAFRDGRYDDAIEAYRRAEAELPDDHGVQLNLGAALYQAALNSDNDNDRKMLLQTARDAFEKAAGTEDPGLRALSRYNQGNALYQQEKYAESVRAYKESLRLNPGSRDTRYNLELALRKLAEREPPPRQDGARPQPDPQQQQPQPDPQQQQPQPDPQHQQQQPPPPDRPEGDAQEPETDTPPEPPPHPQEQQREGRQPREERPPEPRDEAERRLDALERRSRELQIQKLRERARPLRGRPPAKDW